jgi:predicted TIM-barrel fold metal-dependent hydrolase
MRIITLEDHFSTDANVQYLLPVPKAEGQAPYERVSWAQQRSEQIGHDINKALFDLGTARIQAMDKASIDLQVLSLTTPSAQLADREAAAHVARDSNDRLYQAITEHPDRFAGFAAIPTAMPDGGANELIRAIDELGFKGAMVTGHTDGIFLDDARYWPLFEAAQNRDVPIYIHPGTPHPMTMMSYFKGYEDLARPAWGFAMDASTHFLRVLFSGAFDRFPRLKIILGHLGEGLPFGLSRLNHHTVNAAQNRGLKKQPIDYIRQNLAVTTSGNFCHSALRCTVEMLGIDNVMFSVDWPYESNLMATSFLQSAPLSDDDKEKLAFRNAQRILSLS